MKSCKSCLFDEVNYPLIQLDESGVCDMCRVNLQRINKLKQLPSFESVIAKIKASKKGKYDCLIGISGGTDSSYLVYLAKKFDLNPLLLHIDGGWNSEISVINIERIIEKSGFDFVSEILPWHEMKDVQHAFIKANVIDIDLPFDNAMLYYNYSIAKKYKIQYLLNGYSTSTEGIMPAHYNHNKLDKKNIIDIHKKFGSRPLKSLRFLGLIDSFRFEKVNKIQFIHLLDYLDYNKSEAKKTIQQEFDWRDYGGKHYENVFTRYYQGAILPEKFGIDKRLSHLSMLICSKQLTKAEAQEIIQNEPMYPSKLMERDDRLFFSKKLSLSTDELSDYLKSKAVSHRNFKSSYDWYDRLRPIYRFFKNKLGLKLLKNN